MIDMHVALFCYLALSWKQINYVGVRFKNAV